jgi:ferric-dicitrate binding protein FerR (iron transport regulator)
VIEPPPDPPEEDARLAQSLEQGLTRESLSPQALARIRIAVEAEFRRNAQRRRRRWPLWAVAASLAALVLVAALLLRVREEGAIVASVTRAPAGALIASVSALTHKALSTGATLRAGEEIQVHAAALVTLADGGVLRIAPDSRVSFSARDELQLLEGKVYFDFAPGAAAFRVRLNNGIVEHIGTQFEVAALGENIRVRVREGTVRLRNARGTESATAGTELLVTTAGDVSRRSVPTYGDDWAWVESLAPDYEVENHRLVDFLAWVARETGRHVEFADRKAREVALRTELHGSVHGLPPLEALNRVLSTTTLKCELHGDAIRVSSRP